MERILSVRPNVLLVERAVARYAQELLLERGVSLVHNIRPEHLDRLARCLGTKVWGQGAASGHTCGG